MRFGGGIDSNPHCSPPVPYKYEIVEGGEIREHFKLIGFSASEGIRKEGNIFKIEEIILFCCHSTGAYHSYVGVIDSIQQFEVECEACLRTMKGKHIGAVEVNMYAFSSCEVCFPDTCCT